MIARRGCQNAATSVFKLDPVPCDAREHGVIRRELFIRTEWIAWFVRLYIDYYGIICYIIFTRKNNCRARIPWRSRRHPAWNSYSRFPYGGGCI